MSNEDFKEKPADSEQQQFLVIKANTNLLNVEYYYYRETCIIVNHQRESFEQCTKTITDMTIFVPNENDPPSYESLVVSNNNDTWTCIFPTKIQCLHYPTSLETHFEDSPFPRVSYSTRFTEYPETSVPGTSIAAFKINSSSSILETPTTAQYFENLTSAKVTARVARRYSVILILTTVILTLMALSLLVRCVVEKSFWQD